MSTTQKVVAIVAVMAVFVMWRAGTFDRALSDVGLNAQNCVVNGLGAKFCGDQAADYCARVATIAPTADCDKVLRDAGRSTDTTNGGEQVGDDTLCTDTDGEKYIAASGVCD